MRHLLHRLFTRTNWLLVGTVGLAIFYLSPVLKTGYLGDDAGNSLVPGILRYYDISIFQLIARDIVHWLAQARFYPLASVYVYSIFYLLPNLALYKGFVIGLILLNLLLFHRLVSKAFPLSGLPELCLLMLLTLFQFRFYHDPILAYAGLLQVVLLYLLASLISLCNYLETGKGAWLIASIATYLLSLLTYEITYPMFLLHLLCIVGHTRSWKQTLKMGLPFICLAVLCIGMCILLRTIGGRAANPGYQPNPDATAYLGTLSRQLFAALPLSYALTAAPNYLIRWPGLHDWWPALAVFISGFSLACCSLHKLARCACHVQPSQCLRTLPLALAFWILPALLVCLSPRYQKEIYWGVGQLQVYIEYFGIALLLASTMAIIAVSLACRITWLRAYASMMSLMIATLLAVTSHANHMVVKKWPPGWYLERLELERALRAGLADRVPDGATLIVGHRYPWWHDIFGAYFYCQNAGKRIHFPSQIHLWSDRPFHRGRTSGNLDYLPSNGRYYEVLDGRVDATLGYVFLCELAEPVPLINGEPVRYETGKGCLFVRSSPGRGEVLDEAFCITADAGGSVFSARSHDLKLLRCGREWRMYDFETGGRGVDARTLRVVLLPESRGVVRQPAGGGHVFVAAGQRRP